MKQDAKPDLGSRPPTSGRLVDLTAAAYAAAVQAYEAEIRAANPTFGHFGTISILRSLQNAGLGKREALGVGDLAADCYSTEQPKREGEES